MISSHSDFPQIFKVRNKSHTEKSVLLFAVNFNFTHDTIEDLMCSARQKNNLWNIITMEF